MSPKWKLCDKIDIFMYSRGVIIVWFNYTPPRKQETSNFRGIVPIQFLISIKLSLKWALDEVSTIKLTFPCILLYNGIFPIFGHLWRLVAGWSSDIFQFRFLQFVLHKNEKLLRCLTEIFRIMDPPLLKMITLRWVYHFLGLSVYIIIQHVTLCIVAL